MTAVPFWHHLFRLGEVRRHYSTPVNADPLYGVALTQTPNDELDEVLKRGRLACKILVVVNAAVLVVTLALGVSGHREVGVYIAAVIFGLEGVLFTLWFVPALLYHKFARARGLAESGARALWSFVDALGYIVP